MCIIVYNNTRNYLFKYIFNYYFLSFKEMSSCIGKTFQELLASDFGFCLNFFSRSFHYSSPFILQSLRMRTISVLFTSFPAKERENRFVSLSLRSLSFWFLTFQDTRKFKYYSILNILDITLSINFGSILSISL